MSPTENEQTTTEGQTRENRQGRTVTFKDSYEELTPSSSRSEPPRNEPSRLIGFQKGPKLKERQKIIPLMPPLTFEINSMPEREPGNKATNRVQVVNQKPGNKR